MTYKEVYGDLFGTNIKYLAHCVSADYALGAGIAVEFHERFDMRHKLQVFGDHTWPKCVLIDNVFNLVTKPKYWAKPTMDTLKATLVQMRDIAEKEGIEAIAMPKIGAGLDRLPWLLVSEAIKEIFADTDIDIVVYIK